MSEIILLNAKTMALMLIAQLTLQQQLIEAQQEIINLQKRLSEMTPKTPPDKEAFWHIASGGIMSDEAATSDDPALVQRFKNWNVNFAAQYIKPYVDPKVYSECLNQMTRGLPNHIAELETGKKKPGDDSSKDRGGGVMQMPLAM